MSRIQTRKKTRIVKTTWEDVNPESGFKGKEDMGQLCLAAKGNIFTFKKWQTIWHFFMTS